MRLALSLCIIALLSGYLVSWAVRSLWRVGPSNRPT